MNAYIYRAALWCEDCIADVKKRLIAEGVLVTGALKGCDPDDEHTFDSDDFPKGPYGDGGGEADTYQHCDGCHVFLENALTSHGVTHVLEQIKDSIAEALQHGRAATWDRVMPLKGTAEDDESFKLWHGKRHVEIMREWAEDLRNYELERDEKALVDLFLELSEAP